MNARGINRGKSGNVSARLRARGLRRLPRDADRTAVRRRPRRTTSSPMTLDGRAPRGARLPSSEWRFHRDIYRARARRECRSSTRTRRSRRRSRAFARHSRVPLHGRGRRRPRHPLRAVRDVRHAGAVRSRASPRSTGAGLPARAPRNDRDRRVARRRRSRSRSRSRRSPRCTGARCRSASPRCCRTPRWTSCSTSSRRTDSRGAGRLTQSRRAARATTCARRRRLH